MWTAAALRSRATPYQSDVWRVVESQSKISTNRLVNHLNDQKILEHLIEEVKPSFPDGLEEYHYLLKTPFRYAPYPMGSRFRRANQRGGCFYGRKMLRPQFMKRHFII